MVSGLFSAKTVVHLSTAPATASFEHAVAVCTEAPALSTSTTALIARRVCIISSLISSATLCGRMRSDHAPATRGPPTHHHDRAAEQRDELAPPHSITSSASDNKSSEILIPSALAALRFITNSNLVGCTTGRSAGLAPLRIRPA